MIPEWVIQTLISIVLGIVTWALTRAVGRIDELGKAIAAVELDLARYYVKHTDLEELKKDQRRNQRMLNQVLINLALIAQKMNVHLPRVAIEEVQDDA